MYQEHSRSPDVDLIQELNNDFDSFSDKSLPAHSRNGESKYWKAIEDVYNDLGVEVADWRQELTNRFPSFNAEDELAHDGAAGAQSQDGSGRSFRHH